jgi:hypothetical protein
MKHLKKIGLVLLSGIISFFLYVVLLSGLSELVHFFKEQGLPEPRLIADTFLKPLLLVFAGSWLWLSGRFLSNEQPKLWAKKAIYIYLAAAILPYAFSFFITPNT